MSRVVVVTGGSARHRRARWSARFAAEGDHVVALGRDLDA